MKSEESFRLVILDDAPTGIQTVHGCLLITQWDEATVRVALQHKQPFFYMLTNTRAMTRDEAARCLSVRLLSRQGVSPSMAFII